MAGLIALRILFNDHSNALKKGVALLTKTRTIIEGIDSIEHLSRTLVSERMNYSNTNNSNTYSFRSKKLKREKHR